MPRVVSRQPLQAAQTQVHHGVQPADTGVCRVCAGRPADGCRQVSDMSHPLINRDTIEYFKDFVETSKSSPKKYYKDRKINIVVGLLLLFEHFYEFFKILNI